MLIERKLNSLEKKREEQQLELDLIRASIAEAKFREKEAIEIFEVSTMPLGQKHGRLMEEGGKAIDDQESFKKAEKIALQKLERLDERISELKNKRDRKRGKDSGQEGGY